MEGGTGKGGGEMSRMECSERFGQMCGKGERDVKGQ